jgi:HK97 family phage major capsid protein
MAEFKELKSAYETKSAELQETVKSVTAETTIENGNVTIPETGFKAVKALRAELSEIEELLTAGEHKSALADLAANGEGAAARFAAPVVERKSVATTLLESDEYKAMLESRRYGMDQAVSIDGSDIIATKDVFTNMNSGTSPRGYGIVHQELPFVSPKQLTTRVRDLFPKASTTSNLLEYFKSTGWTTANPNNAAFVPERTNSAGGAVTSIGDPTNVFGLKPKSSIAFESASDPVRTIAHWVAAHRNALADKPQMRSIIDNELLYGLALVEDDALLNGDGTGDTLLGILNRSGIQQYVNDESDHPGDQMSDVVRRALTLCELAFFPSNGIVLHPLDWESLELQKSSGGGDYMLATNVAVGARKTVWQVPVVSTPAIASGTFLTGAFGQAAQVYDREEANIRVAEQHADLFARNAVAILAEERLALTVPRPEGLVHGAFAPVS